jgi:hypothetical protein
MSINERTEDQGRKQVDECKYEKMFAVDLFSKFFTKYKASFDIENCILLSINSRADLYR